ncbi:MAG: bifunctional riboflavin kinase/FAD synthetase [Aquificae bacterium]|nr:bifunctional riboflavin kinase/FAD synthetase [Aquificota bacterium]
MFKTKKISEKELPLKEKTVCTIGNFDGFHLGHQKILKKLKEITTQKNLKAVVVTFDPHPKEFIKKTKICTITNLETKLAFLSKMGIDYMLVIKFDKNFHTKSPKQFLEFLKEKLNCEAVVVGEDWKFGYKKSGDIKTAKELGKHLNITVIPVPAEKLSKEKISSTFIRKLLQEGKVDKIKEYLGRKYCILGKVVKGAGKGHQLGYPTINVKLPKSMCLKRGVYAGYVIIDDKFYPAAINFGRRPTIDGKEEFLEIHIISSYENNKKLEYIKVIFEKFIREEKKFSDINQLKMQIQKDIEKIKEVLSKNADI